MVHPDRNGNCIAATEMQQNLNNINDVCIKDVNNSNGNNKEREEILSIENGNSTRTIENDLIRYEPNTLIENKIKEELENKAFTVDTNFLKEFDERRKKKMDDKKINDLIRTDNKKRVLSIENGNHANTNTNTNNDGNNSNTNTNTNTTNTTTNNNNKIKKIEEDDTDNNVKRIEEDDTDKKKTKFSRLSKFINIFRPKKKGTSKITEIDNVKRIDGGNDNDDNGGKKKNTKTKKRTKAGKKKSKKVRFVMTKKGRKNKKNRTRR